MVLRLLLCSVLLTSSAVPVPGHAGEPAYQWNLRRDRDGIQIYTAKVQGSPYDAVLSRARIDGVSLSSLAAVVMDAEACPDWADRCAESYVHRRISDAEALVYTHNTLPFPIKDRDILAHVKWHQDPVTHAVIMNSVATEGELPPVKGRLRLIQANTTWQFTPLADGSIQIENRVHLDPGSKLPSWVTNMLLVDSPFEILKSFLSQARKMKYAEARFDFILESDC